MMLGNYDITTSNLFMLCEERRKLRIKEERPSDLSGTFKRRSANGLRARQVEEANQRTASILPLHSAEWHYQIQSWKAKWDNKVFSRFSRFIGNSNFHAPNLLVEAYRLQAAEIRKVLTSPEAGHVTLRDQSALSVACSKKQQLQAKAW